MGDEKICPKCGHSAENHVWMMDSTPFCVVCQQDDTRETCDYSEREIDLLIEIEQLKELVRKKDETIKTWEWLDRGMPDDDLPGAEMADELEDVAFQFAEHIDFNDGDVIGVTCKFTYRGRNGVYKSYISRELYEDKETRDALLRQWALLWARGNFGIDARGIE